MKQCLFLTAAVFVIDENENFAWHKLFVFINAIRSPRCFSCIKSKQADPIQQGPTSNMFFELSNLAK